MRNLYQIIAMQLPIGTPNPDDNKPIDLSDPFEVIVFIVLPILVIIFYFVRKRQNNNKK
ncbi:adenylosuccinate synthetase [Polaribacter sp.]|uniref:adenylosuccinate synthetase n=1 Tax=Polaribacter sp. TaxID=1920175 RepID=UPI003F6CB278